MIVLNITTKVDKNIAKAWLEWMNAFCIHHFKKISLIQECKLFLLMIEDDEPTYVTQLVFDNMNEYENYISKEAYIFHNEQQDLFGTQYVSFETLMEQIV